MMVGSSLYFLPLMELTRLTSTLTWSRYLARTSGSVKKASSPVTLPLTSFSLPVELVYANLLSVLAHCSFSGAVLAESHWLAMARTRRRSRLAASSRMKSRALKASSLYSPILGCRAKPSCVPKANARMVFMFWALAASIYEEGRQGGERRGGWVSARGLSERSAVPPGARTLFSLSLFS